MSMASLKQIAFYLFLLFSFTSGSVSFFYPKMTARKQRLVLVILSATEIEKQANMTWRQDINGVKSPLFLIDRFIVQVIDWLCDKYTSQHRDITDIDLCDDKLNVQ